MKKIPKFIWVIAGLIVVAYAAWSIVYPFGTWRYKTTVIVETPEGIKTGSAVREVEGWCEPKIFPDQSACHDTVIKGEAVVVDLGKRGVLFAIMRENGGGVFEAFPYPEPYVGPLSPGGIRYYRSLKAGPAVLTPEHYPVLVHFKDIKDPKTVENILDLEQVGQGWPGRYAVKKDHMEEMFGQGVKIKEVTIEMTDESVTRGIEKWIPWLTKRVGVMGYLGGLSKPPFDDPSKTYLNGSEFSVGR